MRAAGRLARGVAHHDPGEMREVQRAGRAGLKSLSILGVVPDQRLKAGNHRWDQGVERGHGAIVRLASLVSAPNSLRVVLVQALKRGRERALGRTDRRDRGKDWPGGGDQRRRQAATRLGRSCTSEDLAQVAPSETGGTHGANADGAVRIFIMKSDHSAGHLVVFDVRERHRPPRCKGDPGTAPRMFSLEIDMRTGQARFGDRTGPQGQHVRAPRPIPTSGYAVRERLTCHVYAPSDHWTDSHTMPRPNKTDLDNLVLSNRAASRVLNPRGTVRAPATQDTDSPRKQKKRDLAVILWAAQVLVVVGCFWAVDRFFLNSRVYITLEHKIKSGNEALQKLTQKVAP